MVPHQMAVSNQRFVLEASRLGVSIPIVTRTTQISGTSLACPLVAGAAALIIQARQLSAMESERQ